MDEHLTKALYLGMALLLFAMAFTAFFTFYGDYENYYSQASDYSNLDRLQTQEPVSSIALMSGDEVINLILEKRRNDSDIVLQELYSDTAADVPDPLPDISVDGISSTDYDLMAVNAEDGYDADFTFDSFGNLGMIDLHKR